MKSEEQSLTMQLPEIENNENSDPHQLIQPMPSREYVRGLSRLLTIQGSVRDRGILHHQRQSHFRYLQTKITILTRYMRNNPFPGPAIIDDLRSYYGPDYDRHDLEDYLAILRRARWLISHCEPMTHDEYLLMRTACLTMMRTMLTEIPDVYPNTFPALWYTFGNMGQLLDALPTWPTHLGGQMAAVNDFFNNPQWLPIDPHAPPVVVLEDTQTQARTIARYVFPHSYRVVLNERPLSSNTIRNERPSSTTAVRFLR